MSTTVLPELTAESVETAERLVGLSAKENLDFAEAEYILQSGLAAIHRASKLWPIIRGRIGAGMMGHTAHELLVRLLEVVDKNLSLAETLKERERVVCQKPGHQLEAGAGLAAAEERLRAIRAEAVRVLQGVNAPVRWPGEELLRKAKEDMERGASLSAEEFRQKFVGDQGCGGTGHDLPR